MHHPFTRPTAEWTSVRRRPASALALAYDLIVNGNELGGGSFRIHEPELQARVFDLLGISADEQRAKFGFLLDALAMGAPPHGGIAFGIDRMLDGARAASPISATRSRSRRTRPEPTR